MTISLQPKERARGTDITHGDRDQGGRREEESRRRENMVGVNMVLAEYHQIESWL